MYDGAYFLGEIIVDALRLQRNLFTLDSAKILTAITPFYLTTRMMDEDIQSNFYDCAAHKNIHQFPKACHHIAQKGIGVPMVALSSLALFAKDEDLRLTARIFAIGLPFVQSGKDLIKKIDTKACLRPWHEEFNHKHRSLGGFPSGHMANVTYMTALFGMRHGWKFGVPLGCFAAFVFADFLNCNRHYFSQLVAGAGLGLLYAFAANKVVEKKLSERLEIAMVSTERGDPGIKMVYHF